ncbi:MAG: hypothetical protein VYC29_00880, partial [Pseudomonadota bacterium]|nr:hypothetical protein [Pseudomonadota bacterium]
MVMRGDAGGDPVSRQRGDRLAIRAFGRIEGREKANRHRQSALASQDAQHVANGRFIPHPCDISDRSTIIYMHRLDYHEAWWREQCR